MFLSWGEERKESRSRFPDENMRKQELVHLHGLLVKITQSLVDRGAFSPEIWTEYEALDINAYSIHARKSDHEEAVLLLATTLRETVEQRTEEQSEMSVRNQ